MKDGRWKVDSRRGLALSALGIVLVASTVTSCTSPSDATHRSGSATASSTSIPATSSPTTPSVEKSDLFSKLPDPKAIGHGYRLEKSSLTDPPAPFDPATTTTTTATRFNTLDKFCPGSNWPRLDSHPSVTGVEYVKFVGDDEREVSIGLAPLPPALDRAGMSRLLQKINDCGTITDDQGFAVSTDEMRADELRDVGDYGIDIHWASTMALKGDASVPSMGGLSTRTYLFVVEDTLVSVEASGGFDFDRLHTVSGDDDLVPLAAKVAADRLDG